MSPAFATNLFAPRPFAAAPSGLPYVGSTFRLRRDPLTFLQQLAREYGDLVGFRLMGHPAVLLAHPDYVRDVLVNNQANFTKSPALQRAKRLLGDGLLTSEGEAHLHRRRLIQTAFYRERLESYAQTMTAFALSARDRWQPAVPIDMLAEMMRLTLVIVAQCLFGANAERDTSAVARALSEVEGRFRYLLLPFANLLLGLPLPFRRRFYHAKGILDEIVYRMIRHRRAVGASERPDLLSALMAEQDEHGSPLPDAQLRDEILTLFLAGHETTAIGMTWTWYLLARNPACEIRLHQEIDSVLEDRTPTFDDIPRLKYTEQIIAESMRLYPPVWNIGRLSKRPFELGGAVIPAGAICLMSQYVVHHDPRFYPDPERFDPDRWSGPSRESRPKFAYFPFGGGARVCVGERFAWTEMILLLATLSQRWRFRPTDDVLPGTKPLLTLHPRNPIRLTPEPRRRA